MSPELYRVGTPHMLGTESTSKILLRNKVELQGQTLIPSRCRPLCNKALLTAAMLRDTTKYTSCTMNFLLIQGKILGLAPSLATACFHYTRTYFCIQNFHCLDFRTHDKSLVTTFISCENGNETFYLMSILLSINISTPTQEPKIQ